MDIGAIRSDFRHWGLPGATARAAYALARRGSRIRLYRLMTLEAAEARTPAARAGAAWDCRFLEPDEIRAHGADPENAMPSRMIEQALVRGDVCCGILAGDVLANSGWYTRETTTAERVLTVSFDASYHYMYGGYTRPAFRGRGLLPGNLATACAGLQARGSAGLVTIAERTNFAAIEASHRVGFRDCGLALAVRIAGRWRIHQTPPRAPHWIRFGAREDRDG